jgi:hypothetical protein
MVIFEYVNAFIIGVSDPSYPGIPGAEITIRIIRFGMGMDYGLLPDSPGSLVSMGSINYPGFPERMPTLMP